MIKKKYYRAVSSLSTAEIESQVKAEEGSIHHSQEWQKVM
jgi:hypothetical protein